MQGHPTHAHGYGALPPVWMAPGPMLPPRLPPQPGQEEFYRRGDDWPPRHYHKTLGEAIYVAQAPATVVAVVVGALYRRYIRPRRLRPPLEPPPAPSQETVGNIRHDITFDRRAIGRLLGKGGRHLEMMQESSGCCIFIIDKDVPPGEEESNRLLILVGPVEAVRLAKVEVDKVLERARQELPPTTTAPSRDGWLPAPYVGAVGDQPGPGAEGGWVRSDH